MALTPDTADPFFREVDDAVRADRLQSFVERFGKPIVALVVVGLLALGGWLYWNHHKQSVANDHGRQFSAAIDAMGENRPRAAAQQAEKLVTDGSPNYRLLSLMVQGYAAESGNDAKTAIARFGAAAGTTDADELLRHVALIRQTVTEFDTLPPATVIDRLKGIVAANGPAFPPAAELTALAQIKAGNTSAAATLYQRIVDSRYTGESMKKRAQQMVSGLGGPAPAAAAASGAAAASAQSGAQPAAPAAAQTK